MCLFFRRQTYKCLLFCSLQSTVTTHSLLLAVGCTVLEGTPEAFPELWVPAVLVGKYCKPPAKWEGLRRVKYAFAWCSLGQGLSHRAPLQATCRCSTVPRKPGACRGLVPSSVWGMLCCCSFLFASRTGFSNCVLLFMWLKKKISNEDNSREMLVKRTQGWVYTEQVMKGYNI